MGVHRGVQNGVKALMALFHEAAGTIIFQGVVFASSFIIYLD